MLFVRIRGWVGGVEEILTLLGFYKPYEILDNPLHLPQKMKKNMYIIITVNKDIERLYKHGWQLDLIARLPIFVVA